MRNETIQQSRHPRIEHEKRQTFPKIVPLPGGLYAERKRCNRPNCRCAAGGEALHGPYLYRRWLADGHLRRQYVKASDAEHIRAGLQAWRAPHPPARSTRALLTELRNLTRDLEV